MPRRPLARQVSLRACLRALALLGMCGAASFAQPGRTEPESPVPQPGQIPPTMLPTVAPQPDPRDAEIALLRQQVAALEERCATLQRDYDAVRAQLLAAQQTIAAMPKGLPATQPPAERVAPVPEAPMASPASLLAALQRMHHEQFDPPATFKSEDERRSAIEKWCKTLSREMKGRPIWVVTISDLRETTAGRHEATFRVMDDELDLPVGGPFVLEIPRAFVPRVRDGAAKFDRWILTLEFRAAPRFNADRVDEGVFNVPAFVGAFAEFGFEVEFKTLVGKKRDEAPAEPNPER
ncbi:MAG: hypothetical protein IT439_04270 [Phycisphaerales bacterium]|nr:hypothetical protein [Phycisphaerales bacterium]